MCVCVCPWSGPFFSLLKLLCMSSLRRFLHFTNKLYVPHLVILSLSILLSILHSFSQSYPLSSSHHKYSFFSLTLFDSLIPALFPAVSPPVFSSFFSYCILLIPLSSLLLLQQLSSFHLSLCSLQLSLSFCLITPLSLQLTPTPLSCPLLSLSLSLFQASSQEAFMCVKVYLCQLEVLGGGKSVSVCVYNKRERRRRSSNAV